jgi:hypothetical protein
VQGIDPGTVVVADNFNRLTDGAKVAVRPGGSGGGRGGGGSGTGGHRHKDQPAKDQPAQSQ